MNNTAFEIFSAVFLFITSILLVFSLKKRREIKKEKDRYRNYSFNYNYVIYGFGTVMLLSSLSVLAVVFIDMKDFNMTDILPVLLFLVSIFLSFFYVIGTRN